MKGCLSNAWGDGQYLSYIWWGTGKVYKLSSNIWENVGVPSGSDCKESTCSGKGSPGGGHDNPLEYSCLENPMDRGAWCVTVHGGSKNQTGLSDWASTHAVRRSVFIVQFSHSVMSNSLQPHEPHRAGLPVHHQLPESTQTHVHWDSDAIQPSYPLSSRSPSAPNLSQDHGLFK